MANITESELVMKLKARDKSSLAYLYDNYSAALFGVISRIIRNEEIAEEVLQDVFLKIWDRISFYDPEKGRLFTWMLNVARNQAIDRTRTREISNDKKTTELESLVSVVEAKGGEELVTDAIGLAEVLNKLPEEQRFVISHLYLKGYTHRELADEFDIPLGTVKTRLRLAMTGLRKQLDIK
ncbi:MAG: sigma-70 family RNA polymerase sigma factor [Cyclobacteriaceae bacterium]